MRARSGMSLPRACHVSRLQVTAGANLAWGLMTDETTTVTTVIQNGGLIQFPATLCSSLLRTFASGVLHNLLRYFRQNCYTLHKLLLRLPRIWLCFTSSGFVLFSFVPPLPTAFPLTFRLASDAVILLFSLRFSRMTFFGTHIFIYSDIFCCCFLNFYPIL